MAGENCLLSIPGFGDRLVWCLRIDHGVSIIPTSEGESRRARSFHTRHRSSGSFSAQFAFRSWDEYDAFMQWLEGYLRWMADPEADPSPCRIIVPGRNFDKVAIPQKITRGDKVGTVVYRITIRFQGARDPVLDLRNSDLLAKFIPNVEGGITLTGSSLPRLLPAGSMSDELRGFDEFGQPDLDKFFGPGGGGGPIARPL